MQRFKSAGDPEFVVLVTARSGSVDDEAVTAQGKKLTEQLAEEALADVLGAISHGFWTFDGWTAHFLGTAVAAAQEGRYDEARANVAVALRSLEDRGSGHAVPAERQRTLEELKRELAILRTRPAR